LIKEVIFIYPNSLFSDLRIWQVFYLRNQTGRGEVFDVDADGSGYGVGNSRGEVGLIR